MKHNYRPAATLVVLYIIGLMIMIWIGMSSCSVQKRYDRIVRKHPELVERDTTYVHDTTIYERKIPVPEYRDSFILTHDTFIETERLIVTKVKDKFHVIVKPDTLMFRDTITKIIPVAGKVYTKYKTPWHWILVAFASGLSFFAVWSRKK